MASSICTNYRTKHSTTKLIIFWLLTVLTTLGFTQVSHAIALSNGAAHSGSIFPSGETDSYTFSATVGETFLLHAGDINSTTLQPCNPATLQPWIRVYAPNGDRVASNWGGNGTYVAHQATVAGIYSVVISDGPNTVDETGAYKLHFAKSSGNLSISAGDEGGLLTNGGAHAGLIEIGDLDAYQFNAESGESFVIHAGDINRTTLQPWIRVYSPNGDQVGSNWGGDGTYVAHQATRTGTYLVVISDGPNTVDETGEYKLHFATSSGNLSTNAGDEGGLLTNGGAHAGMIEIGDLDAYQFDAADGESFVVHAGDINRTTLQPWIRVYAPNGDRVGSNWGGDGTYVAHQATRAGTYLVVISDGPNTVGQSGDYKLHFAKSSGSLTISVGDEGGLLTNGDAHAGLIEIGDLDAYHFNANSGETFRVHASDINSTTLQPWIRVYAPNGDRVQSNWGGDDTSVEYQATMSGTYLVVISDGPNTVDQTGNYILTFEIDIDLLSYVALGDSYSSGEGVAPYSDTNGILDTLFKGCHRSTRAYSTHIRTPGTSQAIADRSDAQFDFFACSGAETIHVTASGDGQDDEPPQLAAVNGVNASRDLITISVGGNDVQFIPIVKYCFAHNHCNDLKPFDPYLDTELGDLFPLLAAIVKVKLIDLYTEIKNDTPNAATLVLGYPILMSGQECADVKVPFYEEAKLSESEQAFMRDANQQLNAAVEEATAQVGLHFVPVADHFTGHEVCGTSDDWVNGLVLYNPKASFHPTSRGQFEYARVANAYLESLKTGWSFGYLPNGLPRNPQPFLAQQAQVDLDVGSADTTPLPDFGDLDVFLASAPAGCEDAQGIVVPGQSATLSGIGFSPSETVTLSVVVSDQKFNLGTATTDSEGNLNATVQIPATLPVGNMGTVEALAAGPDGVGLLLLDLVRIEQAVNVDADSDGIPDGCDNCPSDANGDQSDLDLDGQGDACDLCPEEFPNDEDGDGSCAAVDVCPLDPNNDADDDGFCALDDNCSIIANPNQRDTDSDNIGNACDPDFNQNGIVDQFDFSRLKACFGSTTCPDEDLNGNGVVDQFDFSRLKGMFGQAPGSSALVE